MQKHTSRAGLRVAFEHLARDIGYGWRGLWRDPTFALTTVTTLAVALALVTAVFAVFNAYVLRPYAVRDPYSLHEIRWSAQDGGGRVFEWRDYQELRGMQALFDGVIAERNRPVSFTGRQLLAAFVSGNYFETLGGRILLGRGLSEFDTAAPGSAPVVVLSHDAWRRLFDRDPAIVGRELRLNEASLTIVGVAREEFSGLNDTPPDLWIPVTMHRDVIKEELRGVAVIGRLRTGVTAAQAEAALTPAMARMSGRSDPVRAEVLLQATPAPLTLELLAVLSPVFAAFVLVLFTACANVSNVMLARANARQREIGIRMSVGAGRGRVLCQLITEGLLVAALAGLAGVAVASLVIRTGLAVFFATLPPAAGAFARAVPLHFDYRVFLFTFAVAAGTTVMFALLPALHATRLSLTTALRGEIGYGGRGATLRSVLVVGQVAVSLVLLVAAATLLRNGRIAASTDLGLETAGVGSVRQLAARNTNLIPQAAAVLAAEPRFASVAVTSRNPLLGDLPKLSLGPADTDRVFAASYMYVSPEYFDTVRIPIARGRGFGTDEGRSEAKVAIVSESAARLLWPGADPVGRIITVWTQPEVRVEGLIRGIRCRARRSRVRARPCSSSGSPATPSAVSCTRDGGSPTSIFRRVPRGRTPTPSWSARSLFTTCGPTRCRRSFRRCTRAGLRSRR